jgi:hypothetical protein
MNTTGYENSPACRLIATHCCVCGRDLVDAVSVEAGIGPVCREKYGYNGAQLEPDWTAYYALVGNLDDTRVTRHVPPSTLANIITHRIAANIAAPTVRRDILALSALGFSTLSEKLAERVSSALVLEIERRAPILILRTPYDVRLVDALRSVRGRRWDPGQKVNVFPLSSEGEVLRALRSVYPAEIFVKTDGRIGVLGTALAVVR